MFFNLLKFLLFVKYNGWGLLRSYTNGKSAASTKSLYTFEKHFNNNNENTKVVDGLFYFFATFYTAHINVFNAAVSALRSATPFLLDLL